MLLSELLKKINDTIVISFDASPYGLQHFTVRLRKWELKVLEQSFVYRYSASGTGDSLDLALVNLVQNLQGETLCEMDWVRYSPPKGMDPLALNRDELEDVFQVPDRLEVDISVGLTYAKQGNHE